MKNVAPVTSYRVAMIDGDSARGSLPVGDSPARRGAASPAEQAAPGLRGEHRLPGWMHFLREGFANLPRPIAAALTVAGFLVLINLFTNPYRIWFHWPVAALLFFGIMRTVLRRGREKDRKEDR
jgi:adenylate cyclase